MTTLSRVLRAVADALSPETEAPAAVQPPETPRRSRIPAAVRMAARDVAQRVADSVQEAMTGLGVLSRDPVRSAVPSEPLWLTRQQIDALVTTDGLMRRLVWGVPEAALRDGWVTASGDDQDITRDLDAALGLRSRLVELDATARQYGGAWWLVVTDGGGDDIREPLPPGPHRVVQVHVLARHEVWPVQWEVDLLRADWTRPSLLRVQVDREGVSVPSMTVHRSRLVYMPGLPTTRTQRSDYGQMPMGYDLSVPQAYWEVARDLGMAWRSASALLVNGSTPVLASAGLADSATGDEGDLYALEMAAFARSRSALGVAVTHPDSSYSWASASMSGWGEPYRALQERASAVEGIPLSELYGQAPGGFSSDDQAARARWHTYLDAHRTSGPEDALLSLYAIALGPDSAREIVWSPLDEPGEEEAARTSLLRMQRDQIGVMIGAYPPAAVAARFEGGVELAMPAVPELPEPVMPGPVVEGGDPEREAAFRVEREVRAALGADADPRPVPEGARASYRDGLARHEAGETGDGMEPITLRMARDFADGSTPTDEWVRKAAAWWARNERFLDAEPGTPAYAAAQLWGGRDGSRYWPAEAARRGLRED